MRAVLIFLLAVLGYVSSASCPYGFTFDGDDMCYLSISGPYTYDEAADHCNRLGGSVATIKNDYQWNAFKSFATNGQYYFTSAHHVLDSSYAWPDASVVSKKYWAPSQPVPNGGDCTSYFADGSSSGLRTDDCEGLRIGRGVICQTVPHAECNPSTISNSQHGNIYSDNYPYHYFHDMNCTYTLTASTNQVVTLVFTDFDVEDVWDYVAVYDGPSTASKLLAKITASTANKYVQSTSNSMTIQFVTDEDGYGTGWAANYFMGEASTPFSTNSGSGMVSSTNYPNAYPVNTVQMYHFSYSGSSVHYLLNFTNFYTYSNDYVYIYEGSPLKLKNQVSGLYTVPHAFEMATSNVMMVFSSGSYASGYTGWDLAFSLKSN